MNCEWRIPENSIKSKRVLDSHGLETDILEWATTNNWDKIEVCTNQLKAKLRFRKTIGYVDWQLDQYDFETYRLYLRINWGRILYLCRELDRIGRPGCETFEQYDYYMTIYSRLITSILLLSETIKEIKELVETGDCCRGREDEWLTLAQASELLSVSRSTLYRWIREGKLTSNHRWGAKKRISKTSAIVWKRTQEETRIVEQLRNQQQNYTTLA